MSVSLCWKMSSEERGLCVGGNHGDVDPAILSCQLTCLRQQSEERDMGEQPCSHVTGASNNE